MTCPRAHRKSVAEQIIELPGQCFNLFIIPLWICKTSRLQTIQTKGWCTFSLEGDLLGHIHFFSYTNNKNHPLTASRGACNSTFISTSTVAHYVLCIIFGCSSLTHTGNWFFIMPGNSFRIKVKFLILRIPDIICWVFCKINNNTGPCYCIGITSLKC